MSHAPQRPKAKRPKLLVCAMFVAAGLLATATQAEGARRVTVKAKATPKAAKTPTKAALAKLKPKPAGASPSATSTATTTSTKTTPSAGSVPTVSLLPATASPSSAPSSVPGTLIVVPSSPAVVPASGATTLPSASPTTVAAAGVAGSATIPAPVIAGIDITDKTATLRIEPAAPTLYARVRFSGVGFERFATEILGTPGQTTFSLGRAPDPNTQYTLRISWDSGPAPTAEELAAAKKPIGAAPLVHPRSPTAGPETLKVLPPRFPQPINRSPGLVAGQGWTSLLTSSLETTRRNPCVAWKIIYDDRNAPLDFQDRLKSSIAQVAEATGVPIEYGGIERVDTVTDPQKLRVAWDTSATATLGLARQSYVRDAGGTVWRTSGTITMAARRRGITPDRWHAVVLHELGHIFGLDHTNQPTSVMYSPVESGENWPYSALFFTETDRAGLFAMNGKETGGSCTTTLEDLLNPSPERFWA
jgi:Matrixin